MTVTYFYMITALLNFHCHLLNREVLAAFCGVERISLFHIYKE
jgi:hypothetical protein